MPVTISEKGSVVIPADLRRKYNLRPGAEVSVVDYGGVLVLVPAMAKPVRQAAGMLKGRKSLTRALLTEHGGQARAWPLGSPSRTPTPSPSWPRELMEVS